MAKVVSFLNNKGGVGKTTSAFNVGVAWAEWKKKILFIDLDSQANLTSMVSKTDIFRAKWERTLEDAFIEGPDFGLPIYKGESDYIDYVPTDLSLSFFDRDTSRLEFRELLLKDLIDTVKNNYDFIILDCPPNISLITTNALFASDFVVLVTNPDGLSFKGTLMCTELIHTVKNNKRKNPNLELTGVLVTRYEKDKLADHYMSIIEKEYGAYVINPIIRKNTKIKQSSSVNQSIYTIDPGGRASQSYYAASEDILARIMI